MADKPASSTKQRLQGAIKSLHKTGSTLKKLKPPRPDPVAAVATLRERHKARRTASGLRFVLADRIDFVNGEHWDALAAQTLFLSRPYLRVLEEHGPENIEPRYAMAYDGATPVASMLFQRVAVTGDRLRKPAGRSLIAKPMTGLREHLLVCGNLLVWGARRGLRGRRGRRAAVARRGRGDLPPAPRRQAAG